MPWFKVDDKHHDHRKTRRALRAGNKRRDAAAIGLWCLAGSWSADNLMDGFVPTDELLRWDDDGEVLAEVLVDAELWELSTHDGEPGYQFVNWDEHQPTKADVEAKREAARERMKVVRSKGGKVSSREQDANVQANEQANFAGSSREVRSTPSRPVPSRPDQEEEANASSSPPPASGRKKPAKRMDDDWMPTESHQQRRADGIDVDHEAAKFRAHAEANDRRCVNWNAAFTQWLLNAKPSERPQATIHRLPHASEIRRPPSGLTDEQYDQWLREGQR